YNLWNHKVCSLTTKKDNSFNLNSVHTFQNIWCICEEGIFGKYCKLNETLCLYIVITFLDLNTLTERYYNHCKYGDHQIKNRKIICVCATQFYTGQACQTNCKDFCRYGKCINIKLIKAMILY
ncbi:hypothetical protein HZS_6095, partial [Henneguya salminicola]